MISMKKEGGYSKEVEFEESPYPYGLELRLEQDQLDKLSITEPPEVGTTMMIKAQAMVKAVMMKKDDGRKELCVRLQITDMELGKTERNNDMAKSLYGSD